MIDIVPVDLRRYISERQHQEAESVRKQLMCCSGWSWRCRSHRPSSYACSTCIASSFSLEASPPCSSSKSGGKSLRIDHNNTCSETVKRSYRTVPYRTSITTVLFLSYVVGIITRIVFYQGGAGRHCRCSVCSQVYVVRVKLYDVPRTRTSRVSTRHVKFYVGATHISQVAGAAQKLLALSFLL